LYSDVQNIARNMSTDTYAQSELHMTLVTSTTSPCFLPHGEHQRLFPSPTVPYAARLAPQSSHISTHTQPVAPALQQGRLSTLPVGPTSSDSSRRRHAIRHLENRPIREFLKFPVLGNSRKSTQIPILNYSEKSTPFSYHF
jgi:hypothetical protein